MPLPEAVLKAEKEANKIIEKEKELKEGKTVVTPPAPAAPAPEVTPPVVQPPTPPEGETIPKAEFEKLNSAHEVLKGKYNKEGQQMRDQIYALTGTTTDLTNQVKDLMAKLEATPPPDKPGDVKPAPAEVLERLKGYGEEYVADMGYLITDHLDKAVKPLVDKTVKPLVDKINKMETTSVKSGHDSYLVKLEELVTEIGFPNWEQVRDSEEFTTFLNSHTETYSGKSLAVLATEADKAEDPILVATFYAAFKKSQDAAKEPPIITPLVKGKENLLAPPSSSSNKVELGKKEEPKTFTGDEVAKNYNDFRAGVYNGRLEEWKKLEKEMNDAIAARSVRP